MEPPEDLQCPVLRSLFRDPVVNAAGNTYERSALERFWAKSGLPHVDPLTNVAIAHGCLIPNWDMRRRVQAFLDANPTYLPEGWPDRDVPAPVADTSMSITNVNEMRRTIFLLSFVVGLLAFALCNLASDRLVDVFKQLWTRFVDLHGSDVWRGLNCLFIAELTFCFAWIMDVRCIFVVALLAAAMAVLNFATRTARSERGASQSDLSTINIAIMSSIILCKMSAICISELPLLRAHGREAVRRLMVKLLLCDGVCLMFLLLTLCSLDLLVPGVTTLPLTVIGTTLLACGSGLSALGWPFQVGPKRWLCVILVATGAISLAIVLVIPLPSERR